MRHTLKPHPDTPCRAVSAIHVDVTRQSGKLTLTYTVEGEIEALRLPGRSTPARTDELWKHTCFEVFIRAGDAPAYREFNFSPSTAWAAYEFTDYRQGMKNADIPQPEIETQMAQATFTLKVAFEPNLAVADWRLALSAVLEERKGDKSYWALKHPPGKPDFHHADCFALELAPPSRP